MNRLRVGVLSLVVGVVGLGCKPEIGKCGGYTCTAEERCDFASLTCMPDDPPVVVLDAITEVVSSATFTVTGTITDDDAVKEAQWRVGARDWAAIDLQAGGKFSLTVDAPLFDAEKVVVAARASDSKQQESVQQIEVKIDRVAPVITLVSPDAGSSFATPTFTVTLKATDGSGALGSLRIDGTPVQTPASGAEVSSTISVPATANATPFTVTAIATDARENSRTETFTFYGDRVAPTVTFDSPDAGAVITTATFVADAVVTEPGNLRSVVFRIGSTDVAGTAGSSGHWTATLPTEVVERSETITVTATDAAGNAGTATRTVSVDRVAPTITVQSPVANAIFRSAVAVAVQTSEASSVSATLEGMTQALSGGPTSWTGTVPIGAHDYAPAMLTVRATDAAGNEATQTVAIAIDTVAPSILFTAPAPNQKFKATDFASTSNVTTTWTITDADIQAATTLVNGAAQSASSFSRPTTATDNPANYTTNVTVADRAGNTASASISYSVDRVAPRVVNWAPLSARNHWPRHTEVVFSEPMIGGTGILTTTGGPYAGSWNAGNDDYQITDDTLAGKAVDFYLNPALTDLHGNPVSPDPGHLRVHFATWFQPGSVRTLATGVELFKVSTDGDGVATLAYRTIPPQNFLASVGVLTDTGGQFTQAQLYSGGRVLQGTYYGEPSISSWNVVDPATLESSPRYGLALTSEAASVLGSFAYLRVTSLDGGVTTTSGPEMSAIVSRPALAGEPGGSQFGFIIGSSYQRPLASAIGLPSVYEQVVQSNVSWSAFTATSTQVSVGRYFCKSGACGAVAYSSSSPASPSKLQGAVTRSGSCFALTWDSGSTRYGFFQVRPTCEYLTTNCAASNTVSSAALALTDLRVATWDSGTEDTLLFSYRSGNDLVLAKMTAGGCSTANAEIARWTLPGAKAHAPVRIGAQAALLYIDSADALKLQMGPP